MSTRKVRHLEVREILADRINSGELRSGDRLPSERDLQEEFEYSRSVIRQALAGLTSDGWIEPHYPRGYMVLGPRIAWLSRLRLLSDEQWEAHIQRAERDVASPDVARDLSIEPGAPIIVRPFRIYGHSSDETLGMGATHDPLERLSESEARALLTGPENFTSALRAFTPRRVLGYRERIIARLPSPAEIEALAIPTDAPVIELRRVSRTTTKPLSVFTFVGRSDRFEADYSVQP
jgi:GntR family transcriptional regulator